MRESAVRVEAKPAWSQREGAPVLGTAMPLVDQAQNLRPHKSQSGATIRLSDLIGLEGSPGICILERDSHTDCAWTRLWNPLLS